MVGEISACHALSKEVIEGVSERTGGVPLFVEEVTRLLLERGEPGGLQAIPPTLQQSLAARLDRLGEAREVAQIGAVLGRDFPYSLLRAVGGVDDPDLQSALDRLADAGLLFAEGAGHEANYRFKHALIQDAAYDSLLKSRRQALHRRAAELLRDDPDRATAEPKSSPIISHKPAEATSPSNGGARRRSGAAPLGVPRGHRPSRQGDRDGGQGRGSAAGARRLRRSEPASDTIARGLRQRAHGGARFRCARNGRSLRQSPRVGGRRHGRARTARGRYGLFATSYVRGELPSMHTHAAAFLSDIGAGPDSPEASVAHRIAGVASWFAGEYREARDHFERALALFQPGRDDDLAFRFGHDAGVGATLNLAMTCGRWATLRARFRLLTAPICGSRPSRIPARMRTGKCTRPSSN